MSRNPDHCRSRMPVARDQGLDQARCAVVARVTGVSDASVCGVSRVICEALLPVPPAR